MTSIKFLKPLHINPILIYQIWINSTKFYLSFLKLYHFVYQMNWKSLDLSLLIHLISILFRNQIYGAVRVT